MTRRDFVTTSAAAAVALSATQSSGATADPWYRRTCRWGQTNITEKDPVRYDIPWWREYWKRTAVQGVIINAGGIVAYYPSKFPLHHRADFLDGRDLYGELCEAAHEDGLGRARPHGFQPHRGGVLSALTRTGSAAMPAAIPTARRTSTSPASTAPTTTSTFPTSCGKSSSARHPEGFTDNSWSGLERDSICYCENCSRKFREKVGSALPANADWDDPVYREWIDWNYARRTELWDQNNRVTQRRGRPGLPLDRHEQRLHPEPEPIVPRLQSSMGTRADHDDGPPDARPARAFRRTQIPAN